MSVHSRLEIKSGVDSLQCVKFLTSACLLLVMLGTSVSAQVQSDGTIDWNRYYSNGESNVIMAEWVKQYPTLVKLETIGKSFLGTDLTLVEITNQETGPASEKPALYVDGNIHSSELTSGALALYFAGYLLEHYGEDAAVTELLDTHTFYVRPKFNPDGSDASLLREVSLRSSVRPIDSDGDGAFDEDPSEDLNRDGFITQMRILDPEGNRKISPDDPRLLVRRSAEDTEGPFYRVVSEGIDNDGDGRINEDGIGGLDLNRNFPRNWALPFKQSGAGPFPLSEPETHATVRFITDHPNITGILHNHTSGGFVYRLPSACDPATFDENDLELVKTLGAKFTELTERPVRPSSTDATRHRYGTLISWAYWDRGIIGWVPELWPGLAGGSIEALRYQDEHLGGRYFVNWTSYQHPTLGEVEIGGFRSKFISSNPPAELLAAECALHVPWFLWLAQRSPVLEMAQPILEPIENGNIEVIATVENTGFLPTHLTRRGLDSKVVKPVVVSIELENATLVEGKNRIVIGHLRGSYALEGGSEESAGSARWVVKADNAEANIIIVAVSDTGGTVRSKKIMLSPKSRTTTVFVR